MAQPTIAVIGAGIIGAALSFELISRGANVIIFDDAHTNPPATTCSFGWINAHQPENRHHFLMRLESMDLWRAFKKKHPTIPIEHCITLDWDMPEEMLQATASQYNSLGYDCELVEHEAIRTLAPCFIASPELAIHCKQDMVAYPEKITRAFLSFAADAGAVFNARQPVTGFETTGERICAVRTDNGSIECDYAIVCAGTSSNWILKSLGISIPMENRAGLLAQTSPYQDILPILVSSPDLHCWQMHDGTLLVGENQAGENKIQDINAYNAALLEKLSRLLENAKQLTVAKNTLATRPQPADGLPIVGMTDALQNLHVAVMHSGITLAPIIARELALEILQHKISKWLAPYSISRFDGTGKALAL